MGGGILILFDTNISYYETVSHTIIILIPQMVWSNKEVKGENQKVCVLTLNNGDLDKTECSMHTSFQYLKTHEQN